MTSLADLKTSAFRIRDLLTLEAEQLCQASPEKGTPKMPNALMLLFTQQSKSRYGPGILLFNSGPLKSFLWPGVNATALFFWEKQYHPVFRKLSRMLIQFFPTSNSVLYTLTSSQYA